MFSWLMHVMCRMARRRRASGSREDGSPASAVAPSDRPEAAPPAGGPHRETGDGGASTGASTASKPAPTDNQAAHQDRPATDDRATATADQAASTDRGKPTRATRRKRGDDATASALAPLLDINGIGPKTVQHLHEGGYTTVEAVRGASEEDLAAVDGVGRRAARTLKSALSDG